MSIKDWDVNSPSAQSPAGQGDDEIRAIKQDVKTVFPAVDVEIQNGVGGPQPTSGDFTRLFDDVNSLKSTQGTFPIGSIMMWSGQDDSIPSGWTICNGTNVNNVEVPDLTTRFIVGANALTPVGTFGGSYETGSAGSTQANVSVNPHTITTDNLPRHQHTMWADGTNETNDASIAANEAAVAHNNGGSGDDQKYNIAPNPASPTTIEPAYGRTGYGQTVGATPVDLPDSPDQLTHDTATVTIPGHTHSFNPKYYALTFIMYVGTVVA